MQLREATKDEIEQFYREEYNIKEIPKYITKNLQKREFAFDRIGKGPRDRYNHYSTLKHLEKIIKAKKPYAAYSSVALYDDPRTRTGWNGAEMVFDVDAKDNPIRTCSCKEGEICEKCLEQAKEIILMISDNIKELGYKNIHYVYSGRGYHIRIQDPELFKLDSTQRTEIVNYCLGAEVPQWGEGIQHFSIPFGYPQVYTNWFKYTTNHLEKSRRYFGLNRQLKNDIINRRELVKSSQWGLVRGQIKPGRYDKLVGMIAVINGKLCDSKVSIDIKRILRFPSTLNYKVSMKCISIKNMERFNPLRDAIPKFISEL